MGSLAPMYSSELGGQACLKAERRAKRQGRRDMLEYKLCHPSHWFIICKRDHAKPKMVCLLYLDR